MTTPEPKKEENRRFAVPLEDGLAVEAVYYGSGTLCVSSQAGCALGCPFCASGSRGLRRNLSAQELHAQLEHARREGVRPERVTVSGIGEPLHNPEAVARFLEECASRGLPVSLTTTGAPLERLPRFLELPHNGLMLSLHAGTPQTRHRLVPRGPSLEALWALLEERLPRLSRRRRRLLGVNYLLLEGVNDAPAELALLAERLRPFPELTLHLLHCNPVPGSPFRSPSPEGVEAACALLRAYGVRVRRANRWRRSLEGGCGTLYLRSLPPGP